MIKKCNNDDVNDIENDDGSFDIKSTKNEEHNDNCKCDNYKD